MNPIPSRVRSVKSERGMSQRGGFVPRWKMLKMPSQRGGWISQDVGLPPDYQMAKLLANKKYKKRPQRKRGTTRKPKKSRRQHRC